jgi:DNA polymerase
MDYYVLDYETYFDSRAKYSLRSMTTEEYINDPRFKCFGFSVLRNGGKAHWVPEERMEFMLRQLKLHEHAVISHNAQFDMAILAWKYGVKPKFIIDTLSMARGILGNESKLGLAALGERYGIGTKGDTLLHMDGVRNPSPSMMRKLGEYCENDSTMTWKLWKILRPEISRSELVVIDITTRMFTEPSFELDPIPILRELELGDIKKEKLLQAAGCTMDDLRSDAKFAMLLQNLGVVPPKKLSVKKSEKLGTPVYAWAFAKSDVDFKALGEHEDELVRWAVEARLGLKSTIKQSRAERFLGIQKRVGVMPVALTYYGASTGRYTASSSAKVNMQNLPSVRGSKDPDAGLLRKALRAPEGQCVAVSDAAQIEARILAWLAGQHNVVEAFAQGRDVYSEMASVIFSRPVDRKANPDDYVAGFIGKAVVLGCGYGLGHLKFASMIYSGMLGAKGIFFDDAMVDLLGADVRGYSRFICDKPDLIARVVELQPAGLADVEWLKHVACAFKIINMFRENNPAIPALWKTGERILRAMYDGTGETILLFKTEKDKLLLPNGMWLHFRELELSEEGDFSCLRRKEGRIQRVKMYGGKIIENCVSEDTLVLTDRGWVYIDSILDLDLVHDGVEFVNHGGIVYKSVQRCVSIDGVHMTPDHEVLTDEGWKTALEKPRPYRPDIRNANRYAYGRQRREENEVGIQVPVWKAGDEEGFRCNQGGKTWWDTELRVRDQVPYKQQESSTRYEQPPGLLGVAEHERPLPSAIASGVGKLRRAWNNSMRKMAEVVPKFLGGHGKRLPERANFRQAGQQPRILPGELPMGNYATAGEQQTGEPYYRYPPGADDSISGGGRVQSGAHHDHVQTAGGLPAGETVRPAQPQKPVYDIVNCGPRNRFVVLGTGGPFIVHNCTQALAGAYVKEAMVRMYLKGHRAILQVHDEVVALAPKNQAERVLKEINACMETVPEWAVGLPLSAEGDFADSYGDAK